MLSLRQSTAADDPASLSVSSPMAAANMQCETGEREGKSQGGRNGARLLIPVLGLRNARRGWRGHGGVLLRRRAACAGTETERGRPTRPQAVRAWSPADASRVTGGPRLQWNERAVSGFRRRARYDVWPREIEEAGVAGPSRKGVVELGRIAPARAHNWFSPFLLFLFSVFLYL
jgi:hypothetical protein